MKFQPYIAPGFNNREEMREAARQMRLEGKSRREIADALGFKSAGSAISSLLKGVPVPESLTRHRAKDQLKSEAIAIRKGGKTYDEIKAVLGVSKSSLSLWLKDIPLTEEQRVALEDRKVVGNERRTEAVRASHKRRREGVIQEAREQIGELSHRELFLAGVVAYWAEGAKEKPWAIGTGVQFMNSDTRMIELFLAWLDLLGIDKSRLTFRISIHEKGNLAVAEEVWANVVNVPASEFMRPTIKKHNPKTKRKNKNESYYGCLTVGVRRSTNLNRQIAGWFQGIVDKLADVACSRGTI